MKKALAELHAAVLLAGATGLFGRLLSLKEIPLVWYRLLFTAILLVPILFLSGRMEKVTPKAATSMGWAGMLLGIHWVLFYASIRASNVSIGVLCYALIGFYTALLDPLVNHKEFVWKELLFSAITLLGLLLIYSFDARYRLGIALGAVSSLVASFFSMFTKRNTVRYDYQSSTFVLYEMLGGLICLTIALPIFRGMHPEAAIIPGARDIILILILSTVCTIGQYLLQFEALKKVSAFTVNLTYNLEPVYSIIFAMILFGEARELNFSFYAGLTLIILSVLLQNGSVLKRKSR